jgi:2-oxoglutarate ferredoxin oxidoreductase subunit delta
MAKIVINQDRCKSCQYCINACKKKLIFIDTSKINIIGYHPAAFEDKGECIGCALCAEVCPDVAIEVYKNERE